MLQEAVDDYISALSVKEAEYAGKNKNTVIAYLNDLTQLGLYLHKQGIEKWSHVTHEHITSYLLVMREDQSYRPATIARKLAAYKSFFRYLGKELIIENNPVEELEAPHIPKESAPILTAEQMSSLFHAVPIDTVAGQRDLAMLYMLYATGMRASELVALSMSDVDMEHATVMYPARIIQTRQERHLSLPAPVVEALSLYLAKARPRLARHGEEEEQAFFLNHHGERLTRQGFWLIIKGYAREVGIDDITPHMLRRSFAILMIKGGMQLRSIQELLELTHTSTTPAYNYVSHSQTRNN